MNRITIRKCFLIDKWLLRMGCRTWTVDQMNDYKLLMVDDNQDTCATLSDILADFDYAVDVSNRGWDALDLLKQRSYRLALLDFRLPCMTGVELFQRMRQVHGDIEGLLVTAFASAETEEAAKAAGLRHVVSKPVDRAETDFADRGSDLGVDAASFERQQSFSADHISSHFPVRRWAVNE